jgi:hypothetical protein
LILIVPLPIWQEQATRTTRDESEAFQVRWEKLFCFRSSDIEEVAHDVTAWMWKQRVIHQRPLFELTVINVCFGHYLGCQSLVCERQPCAFHYYLLKRESYHDQR